MTSSYCVDLKLFVVPLHDFYNICVIYTVITAYSNVSDSESEMGVQISFICEIL